MTTLIPDSWELPSYIAGDLVPMEKYRDRERMPVDSPEWEEGEGAPVVSHPKWKVRRGPAAPAPAPVESTISDWYNPESVQRRLEQMGDPGEFKPYDPSDYPDRDFYNQDDLDHLQLNGFDPHGPGEWHRPITDAEGNLSGAEHIITYHPGHRTPPTTMHPRGELRPWHVTTDPETVGVAHANLRGPYGAMAAANAEQDQLSNLNKRSHVASADEWLRNKRDEFATLLRGVA